MVSLGRARGETGRMEGDEEDEAYDVAWEAFESLVEEGEGEGGGVGGDDGPVALLSVSCLEDRNRIRGVPDRNRRSPHGGCSRHDVRSLGYEK